MRPQSVHVLEISFLACGFIALIINLSRKERISFRYSLGWLSLGVLGVLGGILVPLITPISNGLRLEAFSLVVAIAIFVLLGICVQLSVSVSGQQIQLDLLNEKYALLKKEIENLHDSKK